MTPSRRVVVTGNWKMHKTVQEAITFVHELIPLVKNSSAQIYLAVPFTLIKSVVEAAQGHPIVIGAQNMNDASEGAFTGEIAGKMLKDVGAKFVILGHSERRRFFHETNDLINKKVKRALLDELEVTLCVGETKEQRDGGKTHEVLKNQIEECLEGISSEHLSQIIIAYEPVWAIGMTHTAGPETSEEAQAFCRRLISEKWGEAAASHIVIQYGGSVKPHNAKEFLDLPDVDGLLVGGASLEVHDFGHIINSYHSTYVEEINK